MATYYQRGVEEDAQLRDGSGGEVFKVVMVACGQVALLIVLFNFLQELLLQSVGQVFNLSLTLAVVGGFITLMLLKIPRFWCISLAQLLLFWSFAESELLIVQWMAIIVAFVISSIYFHQIFRLHNLALATVFALIPIVVIHVI